MCYKYSFTQKVVNPIMIQPLGGRILVEPSEAEDTSSGGIIIPEAAQQRPREGKVIAVGPGRVLDNGERQPLSVKEGDTVIYTQYGGTEIKYDDEEYLIVDEDSVLAVRTE